MSVVGRRRVLAVFAIALAALAKGTSADAQADFPPPLDPVRCSDGTYVSDPESSPGLVADCEALVAVRNRFMSDPANFGARWDSPWRGVTVRDGRAVAFDLSGSELGGAVPAELGNLAALEYLHLGNNQLTGAIPAEIGNLAELTHLYLYSNGLTGVIPAELGDLARLDYLHLRNNQLTGTIPAELGRLVNLRSLHLENNRLSGPIPAELSGLSGLEYLYLSDNELSGAIPAELGDLAGLRSLHLEGNQLSGAIPPELGQLTQLDYLHLEDNRLTGAIPAELGELTQLGSMYLHLNELSGAIPAELGNLAGLDYLHLRNNQLSGAIPPELGNLAGLRTLHLEDNRLTGAIPPELGGLTRLDLLHLHNNRLTGPIPAELGSLTRLDFLQLENNRLTGAIPAELGDVVLWSLGIQNNRLSGEIPARLRVARSFKFCNNELTGPLPRHLYGVVDNFSGDAADVSSCYEGAFRDDDGSAHEGDIEAIAEWGVTLGCGTGRFCPAETVTRSQMAAFLHRAVARLYGAPEAHDQIQLADVAAGAWYRPYAQWATGRGVMQTVGGAFDPDGAVTRADVAEMLVAAFDHLSASAEPQGLFSDVGGLSETAVSAIEGVHAAGVAEGCETAPLRYCPADAVTRAQMASLLARAVQSAPQ